jgi:hypothetical protein
MGSGFTIPPCPDPDRYVLIRTKEGNFWRRKRGMGEKEARLNDAFAVHATGMAVTAPAARRIVNKLRPYLDHLYTGRITVKVSGRLRKQWSKSGIVDYTYMNGFDLQPDHPIEELLKVPVGVKMEGGSLEVFIPVEEQTVKQSSKRVTGYFFEVIMISGDCTRDDELKVTTAEGELFRIGSIVEKGCRLTAPITGRPWFAILKVSCVEGKNMAAAPGNYGMKVVAAG